MHVVVLSMIDDLDVGNGVGKDGRDNRLIDVSRYQSYSFLCHLDGET